MSEPYVSAKYIATEVLGCGIDTVYRKARAGDIPGYRIGAIYRFLESEVRESLKPAAAGSWRQSKQSRARRRVA